MCSSDTAAKVDGAMMRMIKEAHEQAYTILQENKDKLHELAKYLYEKETITGDEFMKVLNANT